MHEDHPILAPRSLGRDLLQALFFLLLIRPFMGLFIGLRVRGGENLPTQTPFILIANHSSHLDTMSLLSLFPLRMLPRVRPAAAADYFERSTFSARLFRTLFNILPIQRRKDERTVHPVELMAAALRAGQALILFPEGTRGSGEISAFKPGVAMLAEQLPEIPIIPAWLANMGRSLPKGEFIPIPFFCEVRIGPPCKVQGSRDEILAKLEAAVRNLSNS